MKQKDTYNYARMEKVFKILMGVHRTDSGSGHSVNQHYQLFQA